MNFCVDNLFVQVFVGGRVNENQSCVAWLLGIDLDVCIIATLWKSDLRLTIGLHTGHMADLWCVKTGTVDVIACASLNRK